MKSRRGRTMSVKNYYMLHACFQQFKSVLQFNTQVSVLKIEHRENNI